VGVQKHRRQLPGQINRDSWSWRAAWETSNDFGGGAVSVLLRLSVLQRSSFVDLGFLITLSCRKKKI